MAQPAEGAAAKVESELGSKRGVVEIKGGAAKKWGKRWVTVNRGVLVYFNQDSAPTDASKPLDTLRLKGCSLRKCEKKETKKEISFCFTYPKEKKTKDIYFAPTSAEEQAAWMRAIHESIIYANPQLFGVELRLAVFKSPDPVPLLFGMCLNYLARYFEVDGLFRVSGDAGVVTKLKEAFDGAAEKPPDLSQVTDPHVVASLFKLYLRQLPIPLCTFQLYPHFIAASKSSSSREQVAKVQKLVAALPAEYRASLQVLLKFLRDVSTHSDKNRMSPANLAVVFGPTILRPHQPSAADAGNNDNIVAITSTMIRFWDACYGLTPLEQVPEGNDGGAATASGGETSEADASTDPAPAADDPPPIASPRPAEPAAAATTSAPAATPAADEPAPPAPSGDAPAHNWKEYKTKEGKVYYYDKVSKKTQWTRPAEMDETEPPPPVHHTGVQFGIKIDPLAARGGLKQVSAPPAVDRAAIGVLPQSTGPNTPPGGKVAPPARGAPAARRPNVAPPAVGPQRMGGGGPAAQRGPPPSVNAAAPRAAAAAGDDAELAALEAKLTALERKQDENANLLAKVLDALGS